LSTVISSPPPQPAGLSGGIGKFWLRLLLFWAAVAIPLAGVEFLFWHSGETWPLEKVAQSQQAGPNRIFMREFLPQDQAAFKLLLLSGRQPRVMVLSSSRGMQIRAGMTGENERTFLNGGGLVNTLGDLESFVETTPAERLPKAVLLAVDLWWFNDGWPEKARQHDPDGAYNWRAHLSAARKLAMQPALMKSLLSSPVPEQTGRIGISAAHTGSGFRLDGSVRQVIPAPSDPAQWKYEDREHPPVIDRVRQGIMNFPESHSIGPRRLERLAALLERYRAKGIQVAGFAPPFSTEVYGQLSTDPRHRDLFGAFRREIPAVFRKTGTPFVDASGLASFGLDDRSMFDGFHAAETFHLHLLARILDTFPETGSMWPRARPAIEKALRSPKTNFWYANLDTD
jgi:hypothetical protein